VKLRLGVAGSKPEEFGDLLMVVALDVKLDENGA
jgi:hypothetical protein